MEDFNLSFPIEWVKKEERIVSGIATADNIDKANDLVDFNASLEAFKNWGGNIREMHAPIAVGKAINYEPIKIKGSDGKEYNAIRVDAYISKGAQDTWEKVLDGTLRAFSIGGKVLEKSEMTDKMHNGRAVNVIKKYMLGELSLVDNPANAMAVVDIIKRDMEGYLDYVLEEGTLAKAGKQPLKDPKGGLTAAGRRHFKQTEGANLKPGVKGAANTPEKMRRKGSFLTRFFTNPSGPMKDEKGRPTRLALSAAAWGEPVPQNAQDAAALAAKGRRLLERYAKVKKKSIEDILQEDDEILNKEMDYFISEDYNTILKDGEVTTQSMNSGMKYPAQGEFKTPTMPKPKKKKEKKVSNDKIEKAENATANVLNDILSNVFVFYFTAHRAHWNVQGPDFSEYHDLFGEIYSDAYGSIDPFAEMVRKLNSFPPELEDMVEDASFEDSAMSTDARSLAIDLYMKNSMLIGLLKSAFQVAESENEQGIANFIAERIDAHQKWDWQLRASLATGGVEIPEDDEEDDEEEDDSESEDSMDMTENKVAEILSEILNNYVKHNTTEIDTEQNENTTEESSDVLKSDDSSMLKFSNVELQKDNNYAMVDSMNNSDSDRKLNLIKRVVNWLTSEVDTSTEKSEVINSVQNTEEEVDINLLKETLAAVVDEKLDTFSSVLKEEIQASVNEQLVDIQKSFEVSKSELQEKLAATEQALSEQTEQVKIFAEAGAVKKSVDPEEDDEATLQKSAPATKSVWKNTYLPQELIKSLGYES